MLQLMRTWPKDRFRELLELQARALDRSRKDHGTTNHVLTEEDHDGVTVDTPCQPLGPTRSRDSSAQRI